MLTRRNLHHLLREVLVAGATLTAFTIIFRLAYLGHHAAQAIIKAIFGTSAAAFVLGLVCLAMLLIITADEKPV